MASQDERAALEARVYSRAGAADPRVERVDPVSGRTVLVSESEWRLLELDRSSGPATPSSAAHVGGAESGSRAGASSEAGSNTPAPVGRTPPRDDRSDLDRRRRAWVATGIVVGSLAAVGAIALALAPAPTTSDEHAPPRAGEPSATVRVVPAAPPAGGAIAGTADRVRGLGTMAAFRDPDLVPKMRDGLLDAAYPSARAALVLDADGPIEGVAVYAVSTPDRVGCLVARIGSAGMAAKCSGLRMLATDGLVLRTRVPIALVDGAVPGDGIAADGVDTDLLVAEWHADGTFLVERAPD
ncbi:hypothetical protein [Agromyces sp. SYSU T00266]|uniref:hypothetical protein n=1 Tax=Agromyces zhanjiangensis TaxID=3158562 RepID=UPI003393B765